MSIAYYSVRADQRTGLTLNNKAASPLNIRISLYNRAGTRFVSDGHVIGPRSFIDVSLNDLVAQAGPSFEDGSLRASYTGQKMQLGGLLTMRSQRSSVGFDEQLMYPPTDKSNALQGLWWLPSRTAEAKLVVTNITNTTITATVDVSGGGQTKRERVSLPPWALTVLDIAETRRRGPANEKGESAGAISVVFSGPAGGLIGRTLVMDGRVGFSTVLPLSDPVQSRSNALHGAGLRLQLEQNELRPVVILANVSDRPANVSGRLVGSGDDQEPVSVWRRDVTVAPRDTVFLDVTKWRGTREINSGDSFGLEFSYDSKPGTLIAYAAAVSANLDHVFRVPLFDPKAMPSSTGGYFWKADSDRDTVVVIKNTTSTPQRFNLLLRYGGGNWAPGLRTIDPHDTVVLSLNEIRRLGLKDLKGRVLPDSAVAGQVHWSAHGASDTMIGRVEQFDLAEHVSSTYACPMPTNDNYESSWIDPDTEVSMYISEDTPFTAWEEDRDSYNQQLEEPYIINDILTWNSYSPSVASHVGGGWFRANEAGGTAISAYGDSNGWDDWQGEQDPEHVPIYLYGDIDVECSNPINFRVMTSTDAANWSLAAYGSHKDPVEAHTMRTFYFWDQSHGPRQALETCQVGELVEYMTHPWPYPFNAAPANPTVANVNGAEAIVDRQRPGTGFSSPLQNQAFSAFQTIRYRCPCVENNAWQDLQSLFLVWRQIDGNNYHVWKPSPTSGTLEQDWNLPVPWMHSPFVNPALDSRLSRRQ